LLKNHLPLIAYDNLPEMWSSSSYDTLQHNLQTAVIMMFNDRYYPYKCILKLYANTASICTHTEMAIFAYPNK